MLEFYHHDMSVCSQKVRLVLVEKGLEWENRHIVTMKLEHQRPEYLKLNPNGVVPTLVHDGTPIIESTLINEYLDDTFANPPLKPADALERAHMRIWTKQLDEGGGIHESIATLSFCIAARYKRLAWSRDKIETFIANKPIVSKRDRSRQNIFQGVESPYFKDAIHRTDKMLGEMEHALSGHAWLAGDALSLADFGYFPYILRLDHLQLAPMWQDRPLVADWYERLCERENFTPAIADWFNPDDITLMRDKGRHEWPGVEKVLMAA